MAKKQTAAKPATDLTALLEKYKDFEGVKVIERRFNDPDGANDIDIRLSDEPAHTVDPHGKRRKWYVRWVNTENHGRWHKVVNVLGYVAVRMTELQNVEDVAGLAESKDGLVRMGDRGKEVLVKYPLELYTARKLAESDRRNRRARNKAAVRADLAESAGRALGSEAGDTVHDELSLEYTRHKSTIGDELTD